MEPPANPLTRLRRSEWLVIAYFFYVAIVAPFFFAPWKTLAFAMTVAAIVIALAQTKSHTRDFAPLAFTLAAYREMNWFTPAVRDHHLEKMWIVWDRRLLDGAHLRALVESLGALLPSYFELCYLLVYSVGFVAIGLLYHYRRRDRIDDFLIVYLAGTLGAYVLFPYFPSEPPRTIFPGADLPHVLTLVRRLNLWILGDYGIHSSVFPSAHVSSSFSAAWGLHITLPDRPRLARALAVYALSVAIATIYGRYHYAVDAAAGFGIALCAAIVSRALLNRR